MGKITYYLRKKIGNEVHTFTVEGKNLHEVIMESKKLSFSDIDKCGICGSKDLELSAHVTESDGFDYTYIRCKNCRATLNFGQQKKNDDIYYLRTKEITNGQFVGQKTYDWKPFVPNTQK
jgi:MinD superfamily P-loop ATPase